MIGIGWIILCGVFCVISCPPLEDRKLLSVIQVFRHGQRVPLIFYPNDPYNNKTLWGANPGQLMNVGKYQAYTLGEYTRKRYENFLPSYYSEEDFYAYTTDVDRTHMSAQAYIAGLYPPSESDVWHSHLRWQPIPVHIPSDHIIDIKNCPAYYDVIKKTWYELFRKFETINGDVLENISKNSGLNITNLGNLLHLYDTLTIENIVGYPLPEWAESVLAEPIIEFHNDVVGIYGYSDVLKRFGNGAFLSTLIHKFEEKLRNSSKGPKLTAYCAHDMNILGLLRTFGYNYPPLFSSSIYFELWKLENSPYINVYFKNGDLLHSLQVDGCDFNCNFIDFKLLMRNYLTDEATFKEECFLNSNKSSSRRKCSCSLDECKESLLNT